MARLKHLVQSIKAVAALAEDLGSISMTQTGWLVTACDSLPGDPACLFGFV